MNVRHSAEQAADTARRDAAVLIGAGQQDAGEAATARTRADADVAAAAHRG